MRIDVVIEHDHRQEMIEIDIIRHPLKRRCDPAYLLTLIGDKGAQGEDKQYGKSGIHGLCLRRKRV